MERARAGADEPGLASDSDDSLNQFPELGRKAGIAAGRDARVREAHFAHA